MSPIDRAFQLKNDVGSLGLKCAPSGVSLAGAPLLRQAVAGLAPRPSGEISALMKAAYGREVDPAVLGPGLEVIAQALNRGDMGRAMVAALRLRLPDVSPEGATRLAATHDALVKFDPSEPRDSRGRWTTGGADGSGAADVSGAGSASGQMKPILVGGLGAANDNWAPFTCQAAGKNCEITALQDRRPYFDKCQQAEIVCLDALAADVFDPSREFYVKYPDGTVVRILEDTAVITHIGGKRLPSPMESKPW